MLVVLVKVQKDDFNGEVRMTAVQAVGTWGSLGVQTHDEVVELS